MTSWGSDFILFYGQPAKKTCAIFGTGGAMAEDVSLDSVLERALAGSGAVSPQDAILVALHANLLCTGFVCVAIGDQVCGGPMLLM